MDALEFQTKEVGKHPTAFLGRTRPFVTLYILGVSLDGLSNLTHKLTAVLNSTLPIHVMVLKILLVDTNRNFKTMTSMGNVKMLKFLNLKHRQTSNFQYLMSQMTLDSS